MAALSDAVYGRVLHLTKYYDSAAQSGQGQGAQRALTPNITSSLGHLNPAEEILSSPLLPVFTSTAHDRSRVIDRGRDEEKRRKYVFVLAVDNTRHTKHVLMLYQFAPSPWSVMFARRGERGLVWRRRCYTHPPPRRFPSPCFSVILVAYQRDGPAAQMAQQPRWPRCP